MTREEIIEHLDSIVGTYEILLGHGVNSDILDVDDIEAIKEAISALSENKGEWIAQDIHNCCTEFKCSKCGYLHNFIHLYGEPTADYTYCPNCGADMRGET